MTSTPPMTRRQWLLAASVAGGSAVFPEARLLAQQVGDFIAGPPVADVEPVRLSPRVWMIFSKDGFPTPDNRGMMANIFFVVGSTGVIVCDTGGSLQIGEMAIRMIRKVTDKPVVAAFNSNYHGDHWLGNHAFARAFPGLAIHALPHTIEMVRGAEGNLWRGLMERWTNQSTAGTQVVPPNTEVRQGHRLQFGDVTLQMHHHGTAHTPSDLCVELVGDQVTFVGDIAMGNRIANIDDGSYRGTFAYYDALRKAAGEQLWAPGHGQPSKDVLTTYGSFMQGIWEPCLKAVKAGLPESDARAMVLKDPRVSSRAAGMQGFESNIGKYISLAYLEAEKEAF